MISVRVVAEAWAERPWSVSGLTRHLHVSRRQIVESLAAAGIEPGKARNDPTQGKPDSVELRDSGDFLDALLDAHGERWPADDDVGEHVLGRPVLVRTEMGRLGVAP